MPIVSVIIPTYNRKTYVQEAIDSVLAQTYTNYEIIVVDDGSTDKTNEMLQIRYENQIRYVWQENQGESAARNRGIEMAQGKYIAFLDSDDLWLPYKLEKQTKILNARPEVALVSSEAWLINSLGEKIGNQLLGRNANSESLNTEQLCLENKIVASTVLLRRSASDLVNNFNVNIQYGEDWDLWLRLSLNWELMSIPEPLAMYRQHSDSQNQFPNPEKAKALLEDRLTMLRNLFTLAPEYFSPTRQQEIEAHHYAKTAFMHYAIGHAKIAQQYLGHAANLHPQVWQDLNQLEQELAHIAIVCIAANNYKAVEPGVGCVNAVFRNWPQNIPLNRNLEPRILGKLYAATGFQNAQQKNWRYARYCFVKALFYDYSWFKNFGLLSLTVRSFLWKSQPKGLLI